MPATSAKQRIAAAIAEHHPDQLYARNRSMLAMSSKSLHDYAATKGLQSGQRHDHTPAGFGTFAHAGTTREGPRAGAGLRVGHDFGGAGPANVGAFRNAGTTRPGPHAGAARSTGKTAGVAGNEGPSAFKNAGTSRRAGLVQSRATTTGREGEMVNLGRVSAGGSGFDTHMDSDYEDAGTEEGTLTPGLKTKQGGHETGTGGYAAARPGNRIATDTFGRKTERVAHQPGREGRHAFHMVPEERPGDKWIGKAIRHPGALHRALHVPEGQKIPAKKMASAGRSANPRMKRMVALAKTLRGFHH